MTMVMKASSWRVPESSTASHGQTSRAVAGSTVFYGSLLVQEQVFPSPVTPRYHDPDTDLGFDLVTVTILVRMVAPTPSLWAELVAKASPG